MGNVHERMRWNVILYQWLFPIHDFVVTDDDSECGQFIVVSFCVNSLLQAVQIGYF